MNSTLKRLHQKRFFQDFGYLILKGVFADDIDWISDEFERVYRERGIIPDGETRAGCGSMIESSEKLITMLDRKEFVDALTAILGPDYNYLGSAGEIYTGDGMFHPDGQFPLGRHVKVALYLEHLTAASGALRIIPGSNQGRWDGNQDTWGQWGISPEEVPCVAPEHIPGDVVLFDLNTVHNSLNGSRRRRMLNMGFVARAETEEELAWLQRHSARSPYSDLMLRVASPQLRGHLQQVLELATTPWVS